MAGKGPPPKMPEQRRRANAPAGGEWVDIPAVPRQGPIPEIPEGSGLSKAAKEWWDEVWQFPVATMWTDQDIPGLLELAVLRERLMDGKVSVAAEVRQRSEAFGLTPKGRQDRRWRLVREVAEEVPQANDELKQKRVERRTRLKQAVGEE